MTAPRLAQARALETDVRDALDAADLHEVIATLDANLIPSGSRAGIVVIAAPKLTFDGPFGDVQTAFELHVVAGPADDYLRAWDRIDTIIQALVDGRINLRDGEAGSYQPQHGSAIPAYTLTMNDVE